MVPHRLNHQQRLAKLLAPPDENEKLSLANDCLNKEAFLESPEEKRTQIEAAIGYLLEAVAIVDKKINEQQRFDLELAAKQIMLRDKLASFYLKLGQFLPAQVYAQSAAHWAARFRFNSYTSMRGRFDRIKKKNLSQSMPELKEKAGAEQLGGMILPDLRFVQLGVAPEWKTHSQPLKADRSLAAFELELFGCKINAQGTLVDNEDLAEWIAENRPGFSKTEEKTKLLNQLIQKAYQHYYRGDYQECLQALSNSSCPLIQFDESAPQSPLKLQAGKLPTVTAMLHYGFRAEGIACLLIMLADILLFGRMESEASDSELQINGLIILNEAIYHPDLSRQAENDDQLLQKAKALKNEQKSEPPELWVNAERFSLPGDKKDLLLTNLLPSSYHKDYKKMTMQARLRLVQSLALINYAYVLSILKPAQTNSQALAPYLAQARRCGAGHKNFDRIIDELHFSLRVQGRLTLRPEEVFSWKYADMALCHEFLQLSKLDGAYCDARLFDERLFAALGRAGQATSGQMQASYLALLFHRFKLELAVQKPWEIDNLKAALRLTALMKSLHAYSGPLEIKKAASYLIATYLRAHQRENYQACEWIKNLSCVTTYAALESLCAVLDRDLQQLMNNKAASERGVVDTLETAIQLQLQKKLDPFLSELLLLEIKSRSRAYEIGLMLDLVVKLNVDPKAEPFNGQWREHFPRSYEDFHRPLQDQIDDFLNKKQIFNLMDTAELVLKKLSYYHPNAKDRKRKLFFAVALKNPPKDTFSSDRMKRYFPEDYELARAVKEDLSLPKLLGRVTREPSTQAQSKTVTRMPEIFKFPSLFPPTGSPSSKYEKREPRSSDFLQPPPSPYQ